MNKRINPTGYGIDDGKSAHLLPNYEPFFSRLVGRGITPLKLGIREGASLRFWRDYFEHTTIVRPGWKSSIPFDKSIAETACRYFEAGR